MHIGGPAKVTVTLSLLYTLLITLARRPRHVLASAVRLVKTPIALWHWWDLNGLMRRKFERLRWRSSRH